MNDAQHAEHHRGKPGGVHRHAPRAVQAEHRDGQQGERRLAAEDRDGPGHADGVGPAEPLHQPGACRHDEGGGHGRGLRAGPLQQRADQGQHGGDAGHGHAEDGGFGVPGPLDQRQVEYHQAGHGDAGQPQPLRFARPGQPSPGDPGQRDEDQAGHPVPDRFGGVDRRPGQHRGNRDAAAHADHGGRARGHAGGRAAVRGGTFGRGPGRGLGRGPDAALDAALGSAAGTGGAPAGRPGTSGARRPGTTLRYWSDGPANRAIVADL